MNESLVNTASGMFQIFKTSVRSLIVLLAFCARVAAQEELIFQGGSQLEYFCKGTIAKEKSGMTATITEYTGDYGKALQATRSFAKRLNSGMFGPKVEKAQYFFLCEVSRTTSKHSTKSETFGTFVGNWSELFSIVCPESKSSSKYTIKDVESGIFRLMLRKPNLIPAEQKVED